MEFLFSVVSALFFLTLFVELLNAAVEKVRFLQTLFRMFTERSLPSVRIISNHSNYDQVAVRLKVLKIVELFFWKPLSFIGAIVSFPMFKTFERFFNLCSTYISRLFWIFGAIFQYVCDKCLHLTCEMMTTLKWNTLSYIYIFYIYIFRSRKVLAFVFILNMKTREVIKKLIYIYLHLSHNMKWRF